MKNLNFQIIFFIFSLLLTISLWAGEIRQENGMHVAKGFSRQSDEVLSAREACTDARKTLVGSVFGEVVQINQNVVRSFGGVDYAEDSHITSEKVQLVGWTQETSQSSGTTICIIKYSTEEAEVEKQRLKGSQRQSGIQYTDIGEANDDVSGSLEVISFPSNASVFVDHERWGTAPLRLKNKLTVGEHLLKIELNSFEPVEEYIQIRAGIRAQVVKNLKRSMGTLTIETFPSGAEVLVNDQSWGKSPVKVKQVLSGQVLRIQVEHPETEVYSQTLELSRNEEKRVEIKLPLKPSFVSFQVDPGDGVETEIDGVRINKWTNIKIEPGSHNLNIKKSGYREENISFSLGGNQKKILRTIELHRLTKSEERLEEQSSHSEYPPIILSYGVSIFAGKILKTNYILQGTSLRALYRSNKTIGIGFSHTHNEGVLSLNKGLINLTQNRFGISMPLTVYANEGSEIILEFGVSNISTVFSVTGNPNTILLNEGSFDSYLRWRKWLTHGLIPVGFALSVGTIQSRNSQNENLSETSNSEHWNLGFDLCLGF